MNNQIDETTLNWGKFLNPESLRGNLISASLLISGYEILRSIVIERIESFFTDKYEAGKWSVSDDYKAKVLSLDKSIFRASLLWLKGLDAIDDADIEIIDTIRKHRNELAHELPKFITTTNVEINVQLLNSIYEIISKIDRWWIVEFEIPANGDFDLQKIQASDIQSGTMLCFQLMIQIAVGNDSSKYYDEFIKRISTEKEKDT